MNTKTTTAPGRNQEARITVNGVLLSIGQTMAVRVALVNMAAEMAQPGALGDDEHGRWMSEQYVARSREILAIIAQPAP